MTRGGLPIELFRLFGSVFLKDEEADKGLDNITKKAEKTGSSFGKTVGTITKGAAVVGTAVMAGGAAVMDLAKKTADYTDNVDKMSQKIGISREAYQEWDFIMSQSGMSVDQLKVGMKTMSALMVSASEGTESAQAAFDKLGVSIYDADGKMKSQEQMLEEVVGSLASMEEGTERAALQAELLGKAGLDMAPLLNSGTQGIEDMRNKAHELGLVLGDDVIDGGVAMQDTMDQLDRTIQSLMMNAVAPLLPIINDLIQEFIKIVPPLMEFIKPLIAKLMPVIQSLMSKLLPVFIRLLESITPILDPLIDIFLVLVDDVFIPFMDMLLPIIDELLPIFIDLFKQLMPVLKPLIEIFMQLLSSALPPLVEIIAELAKAMMPIIEMLLPIFIELLEMLMPIIDPLIQLILMLVEIALKPMMGYFDFFTKNIMPAFIQIFESLKPIIEGVMLFLQAIISGVMSVINADWKAVWQSIKDFFSGIGQGLKNIIQSIADFFSNIWTSIKTFAVNTWNGLVSKVKEIAGGFLDFVKSLPGKVIDFFKELPGKMLDIGKNLIKGLWDGIMNMANWLKEKVTGFFTGIVNGIKGVLGISSPSIVFKHMGVDVDRGFAGGIDDEKDLVEDAGERLAKAAQFGVEQVPISAHVEAASTGAQGRTDGQGGIIRHELTGTLDVITTQDENLARKIYRFVIEEMNNEFMLQGTR